MFVSEKARKSYRTKLKNSLVEQLKNKNMYVNPFCDRVERYMALWDTAIQLEDDIETRGVSIESDKGFKKNDSVALLNTTNKQMDLMLDKLGISVLLSGDLNANNTGL